MKNSNRGEVITAAMILWLLGGILIGSSVPVIKNTVGIKDPHADQIPALQKKVEDQQKTIDGIQGKVDMAVATEKAATKDAAGVAQQYTHATVAELSKPVPNIETAKAMAQGADDSLVRIFGKITPEQQAQVELVIELRAQGKVQEAQKAQAAVEARLDEKVKLIATMETQQTELKTQLKTANTDKADLTDQLHVKTAEVVTKTDALVAKASEHTGLQGVYDNFVHVVKVVVIWLAVAFVFLFWVMPSLDDEIDKHDPPGATTTPRWVAWFHTVYNFTKAVTCAH